MNVNRIKYYESKIGLTLVEMYDKYSKSMVFIYVKPFESDSFISRTAMKSTGLNRPKTRKKALYRTIKELKEWTKKREE